MGINSSILGWVSDIASAGHLKGCSSILELGPQDLFLTPQSLNEIVAAYLSRNGMEFIEEEYASLLDGSLSYDERQRRVYSLFGIKEYASADTYDDRATYRLDLNTAHASPRRFDVVADFGTSEHVFNIANVFAVTHHSLNVGGVALKVLPTFGDNAHGFYNVHPTAYFDVARENGYEILDFRYVDNMIGRGAEVCRDSLVPTDALDRALKSFAGCAELQETISTQFARTLQQSEADGRLGQSHNSVDYCFVAMRKLADEPFRFPGQGVYLSEFPSQVASNEPDEAEDTEAPPPADPGMSDELLDILFGTEFREIWRLVQPYTMVSEERAFATYKACRHVAIHDIPGDFVECGVYRGGMALLACETFRRHSTRRRRVWLFDTFAGMSKPEAVDIDRGGTSAADALAVDPDMCLATYDEVLATMRAAAYPSDLVELVKGDVLVTLSDHANLPSSIAILRLDTDWYASTAKELAVLYPRMTEGGVCLIDDYGHWLGARQAVDEFVAAAKPAIYLARTDSTGVEFVKPKAGGWLRSLLGHT